MYVVLHIRQDPLYFSFKIRKEFHKNYEWIAKSMQNTNTLLRTCPPGPLKLSIFQILNLSIVKLSIWRNTQLLLSKVSTKNWVNLSILNSTILNLSRYLVEYSTYVDQVDKSIGTHLSFDFFFYLAWKLMTRTYGVLFMAFLVSWITKWEN